MEMTGEYRIPAGREAVWEALNDPAFLKTAIPGCESIEKMSDTEMQATVIAKVGPVKAKFKGNVTLANLNPPEGYTISGEAKGRAAGFAKGSADVSLREDGSETVLSYTAHADVGGKIAQVGSRLVEGAARKVADEFFSNVSRSMGVAAAPAEEVAAPAAADEGMAPTPAAQSPVPPPQMPSLQPEPGFASRPWVWMVGVLLLIAVLFLIFI